MAPDGRLLARLGSEAVATFLRSAAKPFQALPLVLAGGLERWELSASDLALICASHRGTPAHTERATALLARIDLGEDDLGCGPHWPYDEASCEALRSSARPPGRLHNNCSGKHAGMLLACRMLGYPTGSYRSPEHPLQERILSTVAATCCLDEEEISLAVDGCGLPTFRVSLEALARGYAVLADPVAAGASDEIAGAFTTIVEAMTTVPEMVAGPGAFTTRLMEATGGRILGKEGAESLYAVAVRGPEPFGLVVKIADGGERARGGVVLDLLRTMDALSPAELEELAEFEEPVIENAAGDPVGRVVSSVELERLPR